MDSIINYDRYIISVIIITLAPGNDSIYILTKSITYGFKAGIISVAGIFAGLCIHTILACLGLSIIVMTSPFLFNIIKYAGAVYLIYLGIRSIIAKDSALIISDTGITLSYKKIFYQAFITNILNPKVVLFFLAFIPQFIKTGSNNTFLPFFTLGITFIFIGTLWSIILVFFASKISEGLRKSSYSAIVNKIAGIILIILGLNVLMIKL